MSATGSDANFVRDVGAANATPTALIPTTIPAGATLTLFAINTSDETTTLNSVTDPVNGSWTIVDTTNSAGSTFRTYTAYKLNAGAASSSGDRTVTLTFSAAINSQFKVGWVSSDLGAMTYGGSATVLSTASNNTNLDSNTVALSGAGCLVGGFGTNNAQTSTPTMDGAGESVLTPNSMPGSGTRSYMVFQAVASAGTHGFEVTLAVSATCNFHVMSFLEPGGSTGRGRLVGGKLVGGNLLVRKL